MPNLYDEARSRYRALMGALAVTALLPLSALRSIGSRPLAMAVVLAAIFAVLYVYAWDAYEACKECATCPHCRGETDDVEPDQGCDV